MLSPKAQSAVFDTQQGAEEVSDTGAAILEDVEGREGLRSPGRHGKKQQFPRWGCQGSEEEDKQLGAPLNHKPGGW